MKIKLLLLLLLFFGSEKIHSRQIDNIKKPNNESEFDKKYNNLIKEYDLITIGAGVIKNGELVWTGYYGEESPGEPASENTLFDVASITKTVATETFLKLVDEGKISLSEPMADYWLDPDLENDPKRNDLTLFHTLTHTTGFRNWRFFDDDNKLRFINEPGTTYGYSGEGFEYAAKYVESKSGRSFDDIVHEKVFDPLKIEGASFRVQKDLFDLIARPVDQNGNFYGYYCRPNGWCREEGDYSAAGDMVTSVEAYAKFMISAMNGEGYSKELKSKRNRIHTETNMVDCSLLKNSECPEKQGYGLGWRVLDYKNNKLITHGGSDWSEAAIVYYYENSKDGVIIFINAPGQRAINAMSSAVEILEPNSPLSVHYQMRAKR